MAYILFPTLNFPNGSLTRTPQWSTMKQTSVSGKVRRVGLWSKPKWKWTIKNQILQSKCSIQDLQKIQDFYNSMFGQLLDFYFPDPEPCSITPGYRNYFPCMFLEDSLDFERLSYRIWQNPDLSFEQTGDPILIATDSCCSVVDGQPVDNDNATKAITAISVNIVSSYDSGTYSPFVRIQHGTDLPLVFSNTSWSQRTDTFSLIPPPSSFAGWSFHVDLYPYSIGSGTATLNIYDVVATVNYADGSSDILRPVVDFVPGGYDSTYGAVTDMGNSVDGDPSSSATFSASSFFPARGSGSVVYTFF